MDEIENYHLDFYNGTNITELIRKDFNKKKTGLKDKELSKKNGINIFYSNLCSSCKKNYNTIINIADMYKNRFNIFSVNCNNIKDRNDYLIQDFKITEYPQYKLLKNNKIKDIKLNSGKLEDFLFLIDNNI